MATEAFGILCPPCLLSVNPVRDQQRIFHIEKVAERNQGWIDGWLFAMSLVYALHSLRPGSCLQGLRKERYTEHYKTSPGASQYYRNRLFHSQLDKSTVRIKIITSK
jgi:hypothetical protein